ncbi:hypothetical protein HA402_010964 [Bradysia odoriphaga]|nr:hypothetical protein HA402_010964 [Bradysia odoriphaga]
MDGRCSGKSGRGSIALPNCAIRFFGASISKYRLDRRSYLYGNFKILAPKIFQKPKIRTSHYKLVRLTDMWKEVRQTHAHIFEKIADYGYDFVSPKKPRRF